MDTVLGRRALAAGFKWQVGCVTSADDWAARVVKVGDRANGANWLCWTPSDNTYWLTLQHAVPDFNDAATLGCLLAQVQELDSCVRFPIQVGSEGWAYHFQGRPVFGPTVAHCLVYALEAAHARRSV